MHVLVCNDDGAFAPGLRALAMAFHQAGHRVTLSAPDRERSCASHALSMAEPLYVKQCQDWPQGIAAYAVSGTPADACKLGLECLAGDPVDLVVSGINRGANSGTDTLYSGTVAAAMEAALSGVPALAVSLHSDHSLDFSASARWALWVGEAMMEGQLPRCPVYNLNVPPLPYDEIKGLRAAPLACKRYVGGYERRISPLGREYYWLNTRLDGQSVGQDTDAALVRQGWAVLTPLGWSLADQAVLAELPQTLNRGRNDYGTV